MDRLNVVSLNSLTRHKSFLDEHIDPDSGLLDELLRTRTLTAAEVRNVRHEGPFHKRNVKLLEYINEERKCNSLIDSLGNTRQLHIVNYLAADGEYQSEFGFDWPLTARQLDIIDDNQRDLVDLIEMNELLLILFAKDVVNNRQRETIASKQTPHEKNEAFLEILRRQSQRDYQMTIDCLNDSNQSHISEILNKGGATIRVHVKTDETTEAEREIIEEFRQRLGSRSFEECDRILELTRLNIIAAKPGQSIVLYIYCQTLKDLQTLQTSIKSGWLQNFVEWLFSQFSRRSKKTKILDVTVEDDEFTRIKQFVEDSTSSKICDRQKEIKEYKSRPEEQNEEVTEIRKELSEARQFSQNMKIVIEQQTKVIENHRQEAKEQDLKMKEREETIRKLETENRNLKEKYKELNAKHKDESFVSKKIENDLRESRSESESLKADKERLEIAVEKYKNDVKAAHERSEQSQRFVTDMLHRVGNSTKDAFSLETDRLHIAIKKIVDLEKKLNLIEKYIVSLRRKLINDKLWTSNPRLVQTIKAESNKDISGVAILGQELFITNFDTPEIKVYDLSDLSFRRKFAIDGLEEPYDLASCEVKNSLYIMDANMKQNKIIRSTLYGEVHRKWSTHSLWGNISVTFDNNIVLTPKGKSFILEYTSKGKKVRKIQLSKPTGLVYPTYAIKLRSNRFLISYGQYNEPLHRICVKDLKGQVIVTFDHDGSDNESPFRPRHMAIDSNGSVIVIDGKNSRLLLLDSNFEFKRVLIPREMEGIRNPYSLAIDESSNRLFVVCSNLIEGESLVSVYKFD